MRPALPSDEASAAVALAVLRGPRRAALLLLLAVAATIGGGLAWAGFAEIDEVTRAEGRVVPASEVQVAQNLEGGIVAEILVVPGQQVEAGQVLLRIDDTSAAASLQELIESRWGLEAAIARLAAEAAGLPLAFPAELATARPAMVESERRLYDSRQRELSSALAILEQQAGQRRGELAEMEAELASLRQQYALTEERYLLTKPLEASGAVSRVELLELESRLAELQGGILRLEAGLPRAQAAIGEAESRIAEKRDAFRAAAQAELTERQVRLAGLLEQLRAREDRVVRTEVRAPVRGVVKAVMVSGVGAVVQPGQELVEIVPLDDLLLVEASIRPADVAFVRQGQSARVRLTAYDYALYGALAGTVEWVSADTFVDEEGQSFYRVRVSTLETSLAAPSGEALPILPGMVAEVDILTGRRTVLAYLLKPILRAQDLALGER